MAGRPKKTTTETTAKKTTTKAVEKEVKNESADLTAIMEQMAEMQKQILALTKENEALQSKEIETTEDAEEINADTEITVVSNFNGTLILSTEAHGGGVQYKFYELGEMQEIPFGDLRDICKNMRRFAQEGLFYILNDTAINKLRLNTSYNRMLGFEDMQNLESKPASVVIELYKLASPAQKDEILNTFLEKYRSGNPVDINIIKELGDLVGRNLLQM